MFLTIFVNKSFFFGAKKIFDCIFFVEVTNKNEKWLYQMKVGIKLVKVKKFGISWCIPHRVVAENAVCYRVKIWRYWIHPNFNWPKWIRNFKFHTWIAISASKSPKKSKKFPKKAKTYTYSLFLKKNFVYTQYPIIRNGDQRSHCSKVNSYLW